MRIHRSPAFPRSTWTFRWLLPIAFLLANTLSAQSELGIFPEPAFASDTLTAVFSSTSHSCGSIPTLTESSRSQDTVVLELVDPVCPLLPPGPIPYHVHLPLSPLPVGSYTIEVRTPENALLTSQTLMVREPSSSLLQVRVIQSALLEGEIVIARVTGVHPNGVSLESVEIDFDSTSGHPLHLGRASIRLSPSFLIDPPPTPPGEPFSLDIELGPFPAGQYDVSASLDGQTAKTLLEIGIDSTIQTLTISPTNPTTADQLTALVRLPGVFTCEPEFGFAIVPLNPPTNEVLLQIDTQCLDTSDTSVVASAALNLGPWWPGTFIFVLQDEQHSELDRRQVLVELAGSCSANDTTLCLLRQRFKLKSTWFTSQGTQGPGHVQSITNSANSGSGTFWFFEPGNAELDVKVLDGCAINGHYWVFVAGLTDVRVALSVEDTVTESSRTYFNPQHNPFVLVRDTEAFPCEVP